MSDRPFVAQEWSVHAKLTISHQRPDLAVIPPTPRPDNGIHMEYTWNTVPISVAASHQTSPSYGFQRGNITFTTRPPTRQGLVDSGYGSLPSRASKQVPYNRRCKSTCSITLLDATAPGGSASVNRSHSLNAGRSEDRGAQETCEVCGGERSPSAQRRGSNYTTHFCTRVSDRTGQRDGEKGSQDAASQTLDAGGVAEVKGVCKPLQPKMGNKAIYNTRRKTDSSLLQVPVDELPVEESNTKPGKRLSRSPARLSGRSPLLRASRSPDSLQKSASIKHLSSLRASRSPDSLKKSPSVRHLSSPRSSSSRSPDSVKKSPASHKPRTVHIDVYCTGSDASESSSSSDSDIGDSWTSPQTVFESDKLRVVHTRAGKNALPHALQSQTGSPSNIDTLERRRGGSFKISPLFGERTTRGYDSDDGLSSQYPSRFSSYTSVQDSSAGISRDPSSSTISSSSCAFTEGYDSAAATSCKDTFTDLESLQQSSLSLAPSDSFEYADSLDRLRIKQRESAWAAQETAGDSKTWRSPQAERKTLLQQQKIKEFLERHIGKSAFPLWKPDKTDPESSDDDDETGDAWSFGGGDSSSSKVCTLKREDTVRRAQPDVVTATLSAVLPKPTALSGPTQERLTRVTNPFGSRSPSPAPSKIQSSITSPFAARIGLRTDQLSKAERFGSIVGAFRKPGHHVGPARNPECGCAHCSSYREESGTGRSRTRSLDLSTEKADDWKGQLQQQIAKKNKRLGGKNKSLSVDDEEWDDSNAV